MASSTALTVRGFKLRTQSRFRYQLVRVRAEPQEVDNWRGGTVVRPAGATIVGRTDKLASARERALKLRQAGTALVIIDRETGQEVL